MSERVPSLAEFEALVVRVAELEQKLAAAKSESESPFLSIVEAAAYLRTSRQRVDDLLSRRAIPRSKDGARTLIRRSDLDEYVSGGNGRRSPR